MKDTALGKSTTTAMLGVGGGGVLEGRGFGSGERVSYRYADGLVKPNKRKDRNGGETSVGAP